MHICKTHELIDHIDAYMPANPVIIEAGAFDGSDTVRMAHRWPRSTIHAFEPVPTLFDRLIAQTALYSSIQCYPFALDACNGLAPLYISEKKERPGTASQANSLRKPYKRLDHSPLHFPRIITVETITLATFIAQKRIRVIDLLWLDLQGHELTVLQSIEASIRTVRAIATEVSFIESYHDQPLYEDVKRWLEERGFVEEWRTFADRTSWFFGNSLFVNNHFLTR